MNHDFHHYQNYQKINEYQFINKMFFGAKKKETTKVDDTIKGEHKTEYVVKFVLLSRSK